MCDAGCDAGPLSSIVWANFLASGWFVQLAHSCYFFSYSAIVSFFPVTLFILLPKWTLPIFFPVSFFPTCPLLLSFLLLFFPLVHRYFLSCYFFSYLYTVTFFPVTFFPVTFFPTWNCYFLSCYLFSCYFLSVHHFICHTANMAYHPYPHRRRQLENTHMSNVCVSCIQGAASI